MEEYGYFLLKVKVVIGFLFLSIVEFGGGVLIGVEGMKCF